MSTKSATKLTAASLGIGESTVKMIMATFNSKGDDGLSRSQTANRGRPSFAIQPGLESIVRQFVRNANKKGDQVTIDLIAKYIADVNKEDAQAAKSTLWRALSRWGFEFGVGTRSAQLKESERIIIQRRQYLRSKIANRAPNGGTIRPEIYLDESYINKNHSRDSTWHLENDGSIIGKPAGKGDRLIIVNAISVDGWIPNAKRVFKASSKTGDYHASMNWGVFKDWFENQLLPNIPNNSVIHMDNAAYHNVLAEEAFPKKSHTMQRFQDWLTRNKIPWHENMLKEELYDLCLRLAPKPEFQLDRIALEKGHTILRTPPYHPELQPIETCWAVVKGYVAMRNDCTMASVWGLLEEGFQKVTSHTVAGIIKKVRKQEDSFWEEDSKCFALNEAEKEEYFDDTGE
jgi:transposase